MGEADRRASEMTSRHYSARLRAMEASRGPRARSESATVVRDTYSPVPNLTSYPSAIGTQGQGYRVTSSLGSPYTGGFRYAYGTTTSNSSLNLLAPAGYRTPSPVRYSVQPRFRSRFYR